MKHSSLLAGRPVGSLHFSLPGHSPQQQVLNRPLSVEDVCPMTNGRDERSICKSSVARKILHLLVLIVSLSGIGCSQTSLTGNSLQTKSGSPTPSVNQPNIFSIVRSSDPPSAMDASLASQCATGVTLYFGWSAVEPAPGVYDFSRVISSITRAQSAGKLVNLAILPGMWSPQFILADGTISQMDYVVQDDYTGSGQAINASSPVPWDPTYQASFVDMVQHLGESLKGFHLNSIAVTGGSNVNGLEMLAVGSDAELTSIGFNKTSYEAGWKEDIDAYAAAFPDTILTLAVHDQYGSQIRYDISQDVLSYSMQKYGNLIYPQSDAFTGQAWFNPSNPYADLVLGNNVNGQIALQTLEMYSNVPDPNGFQQMIAQAEVYRPGWLEVWSDDLTAYGCS